jgi:hypothetical protein
MRHLSNVTDDVFERILAPANIESMSALDGERFPSPFSGQAQLLGAYYKSVAPAIATLRKKHNIQLGLPQTFFGCLEFVVDVSVEAEKLGRDSSSDFCQELKHVDNLIHSQLSEGRLEEMFANATVIDDESILRIFEESFDPAPDIRREALKGILLEQTGKSNLALRSSTIRSAPKASPARGTSGAG